MVTIVNPIAINGETRRWCSIARSASQALTACAVFLLHQLLSPHQQAQLLTVGIGVAMGSDRRPWNITATRSGDLG